MTLLRATLLAISYYLVTCFHYFVLSTFYAAANQALDHGNCENAYPLELRRFAEHILCSSPMNLAWSLLLMEPVAAILVMHHMAVADGGAPGAQVALTRGGFCSSEGIGLDSRQTMLQKCVA